ncbi:hypothetical protein KCU77_g621, partial [Aureobasidium melanogenum]
MFEIVVELLNKILIFPTKFATQKLELEAEQQRTAASVLRIQDEVQTALSQPDITKEQLEELIQRAEEEGQKQWPERSKANEDIFKFNAQIHNPPERCVVSGLLDTGADDSWISVAALRRAKLLNHAKPMTNRKEFMSFDGKTVQATQEVTIEWYTNAAAIRKTRFFVLKDLAGNEVEMIVEEEEQALRKAEEQEEITRGLVEDNRVKQIGRLQNKLTVPRAGNNPAEQSSSTRSTNTPEPPSRRAPPPPPPKKSSSVSAKYPASSSTVQEKDRTQSSPDVIVHAPEYTSPSPSPSPSVQPLQTHSRSSSVGSLSWLSSRTNLTADSTSTPRTSQSSESPFRRWVADLRSQGNDEPDQEQQAGASGPSSSPSRLFLFRRWRRQDSDKATSKLL